jgi:signal transduction histidine kinase
MVSHLYSSSRRPLDETLRRQIRIFQEAADLTRVLDAMPQIVLILNARRQVVFANRYLVEVLGLDSLDVVHGLAPGEIMDCPHAFGDGDRCGSTEACEACGTNRTIQICRQGERNVQECRILQRSTGRALDVQVTGTPLRFGNDAFTMLVLTDISNEKRRQALERIFFHDLLNVATGIVAYSAVLRRVPQGQVASEAAESITRLVHRMADEIKAQRELGEAESGELQPRIEPVASRQLLDAVSEMYRQHPAATDRTLIADPQAACVEFMSDSVLIMRVLGNMVKNALEAVSPGGQVTVGARAGDGAIDFWVHNPGEMPRDVQLQVFQRSFSTKGRGRGLGTYSIKLLTERYLKGRAWFTTSAEAGTTFLVSYPG